MSGTLKAVFIGLSLAMTPWVHASDASSPVADSPTRILEAVVVTGIQPGPGLWQVKRGDNTLWIMATLSPLPKRFDWEPRELDALVASADQVLAPPGARVDADIGFFGRLTLLPTALRARNNPDDQTLGEVLPPALYQRWQAQKRRWMPRNRSVENRRPLVAAFELMDEALDDLDLRRDNVVWERVERVAKRHDREVVPVTVTVPVADPRAALKEFAAGSIDDQACLAATLARLENDTPAMIERANAWAVGDLQTLRELRFESEIRVCAQAVLGSAALRERGFADLPQRVIAEWLKTAEAALARNASTVAVVDLQVLLNDDGLLPALRERGYVIIEPGQDVDEAPEPEVGTSSAPTTNAPVATNPR